MGLGNPGEAYAGSRHNFGFRVADKLSEILNSPFENGEGEYLAAKSAYSGKNVFVVKPLTFMNRSGLAVAEAIQRHNILLSNLLVISDDFNLPFGKLRIRRQGSDGGHNGLASVIYHLNTNLFPRLRIGIGKDIMDDVVTFVLSEFEEQEKQDLPAIVQRAAAASLEFVDHGITQAMNQYN